jgi:hypothetical protein
MKGNNMIEYLLNGFAFIFVLAVPVFMVYVLFTNNRKDAEPMRVLRPVDLADDLTDGEGVPVNFQLDLQMLQHLQLQIVRAEYEAMTKAELLDRLAAHGMTQGLSRKTKAQLIELLMGLATPE